MWSLTLHWSLPTTKRNHLCLLELLCVFPSFCLMWKILDDFAALFLGVETLRGERRSGCLSVPRLSTSNPIRSLTRLRVKLQTNSESLREDEQDDPEWSRSRSWCYGPVVSLCVFVLVSLHRLDTAPRLAGGSTACGAAARRHTEQKQSNLVSYKTLHIRLRFLFFCPICFGWIRIAVWATFYPIQDVLVLCRGHRELIEVDGWTSRFQDCFM